MISIWAALGIAWLATNVGFLLGAWWASLPRDDRVAEAPPVSPDALEEATK